MRDEIGEVLVIASVRLADGVALDEDLRERLMGSVGMALAGALEEVDAGAVVHVALGEKRPPQDLVDELRAEQELRDAAARVDEQDGRGCE